MNYDATSTVSNFYTGNACKRPVKVHLDTKIRFGRSAAVKRSIYICMAKIPSGATSLLGDPGCGGWGVFSGATFER